MPIYQAATYLRSKYSKTFRPLCSQTLSPDLCQKPNSRAPRCQCEKAHVLLRDVSRMYGIHDCSRFAISSLTCARPAAFTIKLSIKLSIAAHDGRACGIGALLQIEVLAAHSGLDAVVLLGVELRQHVLLEDDLRVPKVADQYDAVFVAIMPHLVLE
mmetsp:Transcript_11272/g.28830  ORF Transcript_11272/g.28830 Transcript_11272/m.28830 type:complete len:157 (-) Transcript_11272:1170-1640(-)